MRRKSSRLSSQRRNSVAVRLEQFKLRMNRMNKQNMEEDGTAKRDSRRKKMKRAMSVIKAQREFARGSSFHGRPPPIDDRAALVAFFVKAAPEKLENVETILAKFRGKEHQMFDVLGKLYPGQIIERPVGR